LIPTPEGLAELIANLSPLGRVAFDTEADSLHCYFEKLCLIQISGPGFDQLVDPLSGLSLEPLFKTLEPKELVLHGADYDLRLLRRVGFQKVDRLFDTMIAARLAGRTQFSLAALIEQHFGLKLAKGSQKANWAQRPLSPQMAEYAVNDTRYLLQLAELLENELHSLGRWEWFRQSCDKVMELTSKPVVRDTENAWRITGSNEFYGHSAAVLRELWLWRDREARAVDRPPFHILRNEELLHAARAFHQSSTFIPGHLRGGRRERYLEALRHASELPESEWPQIIRKPFTRLSPSETSVFNELKRRRDSVAARLVLDPSLLAPKAALEAIAREPAQAESRLMPWQRSLIEV
jgi:ribonuclease D